MVDALGCGLVVGGLGEKNVVNKGLGVAVVEREEARLHLDHDLVAGQEDVVHVGKAELILLDLAGLQGLGVGQAVDVAAAEDLDAQGELVARHFSFGLPGSGEVLG